MSTEQSYNTSFMDLKLRKESNQQKAKAAIRAIERELGIGNYSMIKNILLKQMNDIKSRLSVARNKKEIELVEELTKRLQMIRIDYDQNEAERTAQLKNDNELTRYYKELQNYLEKLEASWSDFQQWTKKLQTNDETRNALKKPSLFGVIKLGVAATFKMNKMAVTNRDATRELVDKARHNYLQDQKTFEIYFNSLSQHLGKFNIVFKPTLYEQARTEAMQDKLHAAVNPTHAPLLSEITKTGIEKETIDIYHNLEEEMGLEDVNMVLKIQREEIMEVVEKLQVAQASRDTISMTMLFSRFEALKKEVAETQADKNAIIAFEENKANAKTREDLLNFLHGSSSSPNPVKDPLYDMERIFNKLNVTFGQHHKVVTQAQPDPDSLRGILNAYKLNLLELKDSSVWIKQNRNFMQVYFDLDQRRTNALLKETRLIDERAGFFPGSEEYDQIGVKIDDARAEMAEIDKQLAWANDFTTFPPKNVDSKLFFHYLQKAQHASVTTKQSEALRIKFLDAYKAHPNKKIMEEAKHVFALQSDIYQNHLAQFSKLNDQILLSYRAGVDKSVNQLQNLYTENLNKISKTKCYEKIKSKVESGKMDLETLQNFVSKKLNKHKEYLPEYVQRILPADTHLKYPDSDLLDSTRSRVKAITKFLESTCDFMNHDNDKLKLKNMFAEVNVDLQPNQLEQIYLRALKDKSLQQKTQFANVS